MNQWTIAWRSVSRRPAFAAMVVALLALGTGANTALFSVVDSVLLKPLPYPNANQLVSVFEASPAAGQRQSLIAPARLADWNRMSRAFTAIAGSYSENVTDTSGSQPERLAGRRVSSGYFRVFETNPILGRTFIDEEERANGPLSAVISHGFWSRRFGRSRDAVGKRIVVGGQGFTIVGVMPREFAAPTVDVWLPAQINAFLMRERGARFLSGVGRMKPGVSAAQAKKDLDRVQRTLSEQFPKTDKGWSAEVRDLKDARIADSRKAILLLFGAVALLLLITVTNVAGLVMAQLGLRRRELAIRTSLGASRTQVIGAVMREMLLLAAAGAIGGWVVAALSMNILKTALADIPRITELRLDWRALAFATLAGLGGALLFGLLPALRMTRTAGVGELFRAGRGVLGGRQRLQRAMVAGQIAVTLVLLASAALLLRTFDNLSRVPLGFHTDHVTVFHIGAAWDEDRGRVGQLQEKLVAGIQRIPGVTAAGITNFLPATGATLRFQVALEGTASSQESGKVPVGTRTVSPGYLQALQVPLLAGGWCPELRNDFKQPPRAMVNSTFLNVYAQGQNSVGRHVRFLADGGSGAPLEIVGVVGDMKEDGLNAPAYPYVYACAAAGNWPDPEYVVRAAGDPTNTIRNMIKQIDSNRALFGVKPLVVAVGEDLDRPRSNARMVSIFGLAALLLAAVGLYGLMSQIVNARRQEIGVRMAIGAAPDRIMTLILGRASALLGVGICFGLALSLVAQRALQSQLFGLRGVDVASLAGGACLLAAVSLCAAFLPARCAARIDPIQSLRSE